MANDFTVADVLAWARTKPADEEYNFCNSSRCALAQFGIATGRNYLIGIADPRVTYPELAEALNPLSPDAGTFGHSFGELVTRLEAIVQETPAKPSPWLNPQTYLDADCGEHVL